MTSAPATPADKRVKDLKERIKLQEAKVKKLRSRVIKHGGRKKAPRLFKAYQRGKSNLQELRDELIKAKHAAYRAAHVPLRLKAYREAEKLVGIMEQGGNNAGTQVAQIIRESYGTPSAHPPWCGYTMGTCYRRAGWRRVDWRWGSVPMLRGLVGITVTQHPRKGDLVRFEFTGDLTPDHVGMFVRWIDDNTIETIEGNTGATGAVSDSRTGGDGVYRKRRNISQVRDFLAVHG